MFKTLLATLIIFMAGFSPAQGLDQWLACDVVEGADSYEYRLGETGEVKTAIGTPYGTSSVLLLKISEDFTVGPHVFQARAISAGGWRSDWTTFNAYRPAAPSLKFVIEVPIGQ